MEEGDAAGGGDQWTVSKVTNPGKELLGPQPLPFPLFLYDYGEIHRSPEIAGVPNHVLLQLSQNKPVLFIKLPHEFVSMTQRSLTQSVTMFSNTRYNHCYTVSQQSVGFHIPF